MAEHKGIHLFVVVRKAVADDRQRILHYADEHHAQEQHRQQLCLLLRLFAANQRQAEHARRAVEQHIHPERARREDAAQITPEVHAVQRTVIAVQRVRVGHERRAQCDGFLCGAVHHCQHVLRMAQIVAHERHRRHMVIEFLL